MEEFKKNIVEKLSEAKKEGKGFIEIQLSDEKFCEWLEDHFLFKVLGTNIDLYSFPSYFNPSTCKSVLLYNLYKLRGHERFKTVYLSPAQEKECTTKGLAIEFRVYRVYDFIK